MFVPEVQGGDPATIWRCPKTWGWNSRTPFSSIDPTTTSLDPATLSEPLSSRKEKVGVQGPDPNPWINPRNCQGPSGPHCFSAYLTHGHRPNPAPTGSRQDKRPEGGGLWGWGGRGWP